MLIGIVADDLTGAADSVAPFAQQGYIAGVGLSVDAGARYPPREWDALALNTELRDRTIVKPTLIVSVARRATRRLIACAPRIYFKKIDSTLRGHLRPELDGMLRELPGRTALICPASPANGRTVEHGVLHVGGVPLIQTGFVEGEAEPERFATVRSAFEMAAEPTTGEIGLTILRKGVETVERELDRQRATGVRTVFCDAVTPDDMHILAQLVLHRPEHYLPVGSAGFTRAIAESMPRNTTPGSPTWDTERFTRGRILVVVGSMHPISRRQAHRLLRGEGIIPLVMEYADDSETYVNSQIFHERWRAGEKLFVLITSEETNSRASGDIVPILWDMATWAGLPTTVSPFDGYVVTGGHTAQQICDAFWGTALQIFGESEPGIVRAMLLRDRDLPDIPMILKAGGFGDEGTLARCVGLE
ncbi:MAG: hypothetical protein JWL77_2337 [Chthonomonadaceae bacterium]|nr:hypothetical protein [Chthonomonadaceae bacterium]